jgi:SAM-dependent methyltransferase
VTSVSHERWQDAQEAERGFWSTDGFALDAFFATVGPSMQTAAWAAPNLKVPTGDWLEIGVGPLGVGCTHFLSRRGALHTLDPIEPTAPEEWQLPEPCKALVRRCREETVASHVGQAEQIDFPDGTFAVVALHNMLDHAEDPGAVLREVRRILGSGGQLVLAVDTFSTLGEVKYRLITRRQRRDTILVRAHPHRFSSNEVIQRVAAAGFDVAQADAPSRVLASAGRCYRMRVLAA